VKIVPPPTALPIPVRISGDWTKPQGGIDWGGLLSGLTSSTGLGGPQGIAPPAEPPPAEVQAAIKRVLESDIPADRLSEEGKAMLRSLLPAGTSPQ
jgi:AsmA protein